MIFLPLFYRMHSPCWACFKSYWIAKCLGLLFMHLRTWSFSFIFVVFDQSLPPALPNYRKNSVQSRKQVLRIHISFVGQWPSCMWHNFCWHIGYSLFSFFLFFFFSCQKKRLFPLKSQVVRGGGGFSVTLSESFQHHQLQFPLLLFQLQCSETLWLCGHSILSRLIQRFVYMTKGRPP